MLWTFFFHICAPPRRARTGVHGKLTLARPRRARIGLHDEPEPTSTESSYQLVHGMPVSASMSSPQRHPRTMVVLHGTRRTSVSANDNGVVHAQAGGPCATCQGRSRRRRSCRWPPAARARGFVVVLHDELFYESLACMPDTLPLSPRILLEQRKTKRGRRAWLLIAKGD